MALAVPPLAPTELVDFKTQYERDHLIPFCRRVYPKYRVAKHIELIAEPLERVVHRDLRFLAIMLPPRMSKSTTASECFPAFFLGNRPDDWVMQVSHTARLAEKFSRRARRIVEGPAYPWPHIKPSRDSRSVQEWEIAGHTGGLYAAGVSGNVTGRGAHALLVDDPVRSAEDADSEVIREKTWEWFEQDAYSRLQPGGAVVLIGTRWHEADLIGRALNMPGIDWHVVRIPAEAEDDDPLGREPGEWLWPEWRPAHEWEQIKRVSSPRTWNALYQQRPTSEEGAMFPRDAWNWYTPGTEPPMAEIVIAVDSAFKEGVGTNYSVFAAWGHDGLGSYYLLDLWRDRTEFPGLIRAGDVMFAVFRGKARKLGMLVEDKASGQSAIQVWRKAHYGDVDPHNPGKPTLWPALPVVPIPAPAGQSKIARADGVTPLVLAQRVYLPLHREWVKAFIQEHVEFPLGAHDDMVDTTSIALGWFMNPPRRGLKSY